MVGRIFAVIKVIIIAVVDVKFEKKFSSSHWSRKNNFNYLRYV